MTHFFEDKQQYLAYQQAFRQLSRGKQATSEDHVLYNFIRGRDLKHGFSPLINPKKIDPYYKDEWRGFTQAKAELIRKIRDREHLRNWFAKYGTNSSMAVVYMFTSRYSETISEEAWTKLYEALK